MASTLNGNIVLDLTHVLAGPFAGVILSDLGAQVIKIEQPGIGDRSRASGPFLGEESSYFMSVNRGKLGLSIDLSVPEGKALFLRLASKADVVLENFAPGTMDRLGLGYETLRQYNSRLIYAAISGFGQNGPYAGKSAMDIVVQGMGGIMSITGEPDGPPIRPGVSQGDITAGLYTVIGILAALNERNQSGLGQFVDIAMLDCQIAILENAFARYFATGEIPQPLGTRHPVTAPFQAFKTKDGYITVALIEGRKERWPLMCVAMDRLDLIDDPRFNTGWLRSQNYKELEPMLTEAMLKKTCQEWLDELEALGIPCGPVNTIDKASQDPQVLHRNMIKDIQHPRLGMIKMLGTPIKLSRSPTGSVNPAPELGEHTRILLKELLELSSEEIDSLNDGQVI